MMSREGLEKFLRYEPETGLFFWKVDRRGRASAGDRAGSGCSGGYLQITVCGYAFLAHRLAWWMTFGEMPREQIDHINGDRTDNRICNLRLATHAQNQQNSRRRSDNTTGFKGVYRYKDRFYAQIFHEDRQVHLGMFNTAEDAHSAYCKAAKELRGEFARFA